MPILWPLEQTLDANPLAPRTSRTAPRTSRMAPTTSRTAPTTALDALTELQTYNSYTLTWNKTIYFQLLTICVCVCGACDSPQMLLMCWRFQERIDKTSVCVCVCVWCVGQSTDALDVLEIPGKNRQDVCVCVCVCLLALLTCSLHLLQEKSLCTL